MTSDEVVILGVISTSLSLVLTIVIALVITVIQMEDKKEKQDDK